MEPELFHCIKRIADLLKDENPSEEIIKGICAFINQSSTPKLPKKQMLDACIMLRELYGHEEAEELLKNLEYRIKELVIDRDSGPTPSFPRFYWYLTHGLRMPDAEAVSLERPEMIDRLAAINYPFNSYAFQIGIQQKSPCVFNMMDAIDMDISGLPQKTPLHTLLLVASTNRADACQKILPYIDSSTQERMTEAAMMGQAHEAIGVLTENFPIHRSSAYIAEMISVAAHTGNDKTIEALCAKYPGFLSGKDTVQNDLIYRILTEIMALSDFKPLNNEPFYIQRLSQFFKECYLDQRSEHEERFDNKQGFVQDTSYDASAALRALAIITKAAEVHQPNFPKIYQNYTETRIAKVCGYCIKDPEILEAVTNDMLTYYQQQLSSPEHQIYRDYSYGQSR